MHFHVRLFAGLRERAGTDKVRVDLPAGGTVADLLRRLAEVEPRLAEPLAATSLVTAVNRVYVAPETVLATGDEIALIPPVSGGSGDPRAQVAIGRQPLDVTRLERSIATPGSGAMVAFTGRTRDVERLDYEAYAPMAEERMAKIVAAVASRHRLEGIAAEHRIGPVPRAEASVAVVVAARHRGAAFAAAREAIDRIKAEVPIWKREVEGERTEWVRGTVPRVP